ncbi:helix-turn-helix domain-containing protein [Mitsuokella multacida]|uniref:helix-turn-helix domain-containing protein n=1 Tax=Mitsuokella multacida TaxID=52226 RepID=UPI00265E0617|nr:helix-turn-helix domain-containing protein [Mitsuokella multacida]
MNDYVNVPLSAIEDDNLTPIELRVYCIILMFAKKCGGCCFECNRLMGELVDRDARVIQKAIQSLARKKYIAVEYTHNTQRDIYPLNPPKEEKKLFRERICNRSKL